MSEFDTIEFPGQPLLPGIDDESARGSELLESEASQRGRYSGKIVEKNLGRVNGILTARAMGFPIRQVCEAYSVGPHTIAEIERRHGVKLATLKDRMARKFGVFAELGLDRAISEVKKMDIDKLMISLGIAIDKFQLLNGDASVIIGTPTGEGSRFSVDSLRARLGARPVIDVTPALTGSDTGEIEPTRERVALPVGAPSSTPST